MDDLKEPTAKEILLSVKPDRDYVRKAETGKFPLLSENPTDAKALYESFLAAPEESLEKYHGVRLRVSGIASRVGIDIHGLPSVELSDKVESGCYVLCVFWDSRILDQVQAGERVSIEGNYLVFYDGYGITIKNSDLVEIGETKSGDDGL